MIKVKEKKTAVPGFILERTAKRLKQYFQQQLSAADTDITIDQWVVLQVLDRQDGISQLEIARATFKDAPTITRIIDLLCKKGLTRRVSDPEDRRRFRIRLTGAGQAKIAEVTPIIMRARETAWHGIDEEDMSVMVRTLDAIFENLQ